MPVRALSATALAALLLPAVPAGPTTTRYRIDQRLEQEVDASAVGGGKQNVVIKTSSFLTLVAADSAGGRSIKVVIDSVTADSLPPGMPPTVFADVKGMTYTGFLDASGKLGELKVTPEKQGVPNLGETIRQFFPRVKPNTKPGETWTDTTEVSSPVGGGQISVRTVTNYKAAAADPKGPPRSIKVDGASASSLAGTQQTPGGSADIEGTGSGTSSFTVSGDGRVLSGTYSGTQNMTVSLAQAPAPIPVLVKTVTTINALN